MSENLQDLIPELGNHVRFAEINIEASPNTSNSCAVRALPTLILFKNAGIMASQNGNSPKPKIRCWFIDPPGL